MDILSDGFDFGAVRRSDPGDFGWGLYLTRSLARARAIGSDVLIVMVDISRFARIPNPYFLSGTKEMVPHTEAERLFHRSAFRNGEMITVMGNEADRVAASKDLAEVFVRRGWGGIVTDGDEVVVFDSGCIRSIQGILIIQ
jgi:hypothetical protein